MDTRIFHRIRSNRLRIPTVWALVVAFIAVTSACERHERVPPSDYGDVEQTVKDEWEIETTDAIYRVNWFTATDSTIVIMDAQWKELKSSATRYPAHSVTRVANPEVPIVLPRDEVLNVARVQFSEGGTALAVGVGTIAILAVAFFVFLGLALRDAPLD